MSELVQVATEQGVRVITLARADRKNALNREMYDALTAQLHRAAVDDSVRVVLFQSEGDVYCGGNDMADFVAAAQSADGMSSVLAFLDALVQFSKPMAAAVQGAAVGIGTTMLLHCDLAWCAPEAVFKMPFAQLALVPEAGSTLLLPELVGHRKAFQWSVLGDPISAEEACRVGFVNAVVPRDALRATAFATCVRLAQMPPAAVRESRRLLRETQVSELRAAMAAEMQAFGERLQSEEAMEAFTAFLQKRQPDFSRFV